MRLFTLRHHVSLIYDNTLVHRCMYEYFQYLNYYSPILIITPYLCQYTILYTVGILYIKFMLVYYTIYYRNSIHKSNHIISILFNIQVIDLTYGLIALLHNNENIILVRFMSLGLRLLLRHGQQQRYHYYRQKSPNDIIHQNGVCLTSRKYVGNTLKQKRQT